MDYNQPYGGAAGAPYINGNPATATAGSIPPAAAIEYPQREIVDLITHAGLVPSNADLGQIAKAIQTGKLNFATVSGAADALVLTLSPAPTALTHGMRIWAEVATANATTAPTANVNGLGALPIKRADGTAVGLGDVTGALCFEFDGANLRIANASIQLVRNLSGALGSTFVEFDTGSGNFTVPAGVYWLLNIELTAAGGGGGGANAGQAGGGGNGGFTCRVPRLAVVPGQVIPYAVGVGGSAGTAGGGADGQAGTDTTFGSFTAKAGKGGACAGASGAAWDAGSTGTIVLSGQQGESGAIIGGSFYWGGHGGNAVAGGMGGNGSRGGTAGNPGLAPGGAGGGGAQGFGGGAGAPGRITFMY